jgi:hypothetical protein
MGWRAWGAAEEVGGEEEEEEEEEEGEDAAFSAHTRSHPSLAVDTRNGWCGCAATSVLILPCFRFFTYSCDFF